MTQAETRERAYSIFDRETSRVASYPHEGILIDITKCRWVEIAGRHVRSASPLAFPCIRNAGRALNAIAHANSWSCIDRLEIIELEAHVMRTWRLVGPPPKGTR